MSGGASSESAAGSGNVAGSALLDEAGLVRWGESMGRRADPPLFIALSGPLGAGKSVLARAIARGAGVEATMPSPTFNLLFRYPARSGVEVVHVDLYRVERASELVELGWEELPGESEVVLVEWPERAGGRLPPDRWEVRLEVPAPGALGGRREVTVRRVGAPPDIPLR